MPQDQDTYLQEKDVDEPEKQAKEKEEEDMEFTVRSYCETQYNSVVRASTLASFLSLQSNTHTYTHIQAHLLCSVKVLPPIWPLKYASGFILLLFLKSVVPLLRDPYQPCHFSDFPTLHPFFRSSLSKRRRVVVELQRVSVCLCPCLVSVSFLLARVSSEVRYCD